MKSSVYIAGLVALGVSEEQARAKAVGLLQKGERITEDDSDLGVAKLERASDRRAKLLEHGLDESEADDLVKGQIAAGTLLDDLAKSDPGEPASLEAANAEIDAALDALAKGKKKAKRKEPDEDDEDEDVPSDGDEDSEDDYDFGKGGSVDDVAEMLAKAVEDAVAEKLAPIAQAVATLLKGQKANNASLAALAKGGLAKGDDDGPRLRGLIDPTSFETAPHPYDKPEKVQKSASGVNRDALLRKASDLADNGPEKAKRLAAADVVDLIEQGAPDAQITAAATRAGLS